MRLDPSLRIDIDGSMEIATGEMENQVSVYDGNQCTVQGKIRKVTNHRGNLSSGPPKDRSSGW